MKKLFIFALFLSFSAFFAGAAVIGIDFGTEFFKISLISPGKSFVIIENTTSKRKTPTSVNFIDLLQKSNGFLNILLNLDRVRQRGKSLRGGRSEQTQQKSAKYLCFPAEIPGRAVQRRANLRDFATKLRRLSL